MSDTLMPFIRNNDAMTSNTVKKIVNVFKTMLEVGKVENECRIAVLDLSTSYFFPQNIQ